MIQLRFREKEGKQLISFEDFKPDDSAPIYVQIVLHIKRGIVAGNIQNQDALPSRRVLSAMLGINPNTVQKAYKILEEEQLIVSYFGSGSVVVITPEVVSKLSQELMLKETKKVVDAMKKMGFDKDRALELIASMWEKEEE